MKLYKTIGLALFICGSVSFVFANAPSADDMFSDLNTHYGVAIKEASLVSGLKLTASAQYAGNLHYEISMGVTGKADLLKLVSRVTYSIGPSELDHPRLNDRAPLFHRADFQKHFIGYGFFPSEVRGEETGEIGFLTKVTTKDAGKHKLAVEVLFSDGTAATIGTVWLLEVERLLQKPQKTIFSITPNYVSTEDKPKEDTSLLASMGNLLSRKDDEDKASHYLRNFKIKIDGPQVKDIERVEYVIRHSYLSFSSNNGSDIDIKEAKLDEDMSFVVECTAAREQIDKAFPLSTFWQLYLVVVFKNGTVTTTQTKRLVALSDTQFGENDHNQTQKYVGTGNNKYLNTPVSNAAGTNPR